MDAGKLVRGWPWNAAPPNRLMVLLMWAALGLVAALGLPNARAAVPHPFHISMAEMEYNAKERRLEVALKLHSIDLENALSRQAGRRINVEKDDIKELVEKYLNQHFQVFAVDSSVEASRLPRSLGDQSTQHEPEDKPAGGEPALPSTWLIQGAEVASKDANLRSKVNFVGQELETSWLWIYFELKIEPKRLEQASGNRWGMRNTILMDGIRDQLNTVSIRSGSERQSLKFSRRVYLHELKSSWLEEPKLAELKQESGS
jgi:hypothetical protein